MNEGRIMPGQIQGITSKGEIRNIRTDENGNILVKQIISEDSAASATDVTTLKCELVEEAKSVSVEKYVTEISVANYSEENSVSLIIGNLTYTIGANMATDITINKEVENIAIAGTQGDIKVQLIVKGVE